MLKVGSHMKDFTSVQWKISSVCNFSCSYCPTECHDGFYKFPDGISNILQFIKDLSQNNKHVYFELTGGEPTLWPELIPFLETVDSYSNVRVGMSTNGSRSEKFWKKLCVAKLSVPIVLNFSYHAALCDPDKYYRNLEIISRNHVTVATFMLVPEFLQQTLAVYNKVKKHLPVDCMLKVLRDKFHPSQHLPGYTREMYELISNSDYLYKRSSFHHKPQQNFDWYDKVYIDGKKVFWSDIIIRKEHKFKNWKCFAGSKRFFINFNGDVFPCISVRTKDYCLGNIYKGVVKPLDNYMICPVDYCPCKPDAATPKYSPQYKGNEIAV